MFAGAIKVSPLAVALAINKAKWFKAVSPAFFSETAGARKGGPRADAGKGSV